MWKSWQGANLGQLLGPWTLYTCSSLEGGLKGLLLGQESLPGATVKVFATCLVLSRQKGVLVCPQELQGAKQGSLSQPRARPMTSVALPGLGQTHSGYTHE